MRSYTSAAERMFQHKLALRLLEKDERRKAEARRLHAHLRLGIASADELRQVLPTGRIGRLD